MFVLFCWWTIDVINDDVKIRFWHCKKTPLRIAWIFIWISYSNFTLLKIGVTSILDLEKRTWTSLTEFGTFTSAVKCFQCSKGFVIPYPTLLNSHLKDGKALDRDCRPTLILPIHSIWLKPNYVWRITLNDFFAGFLDRLYCDIETIEQLACPKSMKVMSLKIWPVNKAFLFWYWQWPKRYLFRNKIIET